MCAVFAPGIANSLLFQQEYIGVPDWCYPNQSMLEVVDFSKTKFDNRNWIVVAWGNIEMNIYPHNYSHCQIREAETCSLGL